MLSLPYRDIRAPKDVGGSAAKHIYRHFNGPGDALLLTRYQIGGGAQPGGSRVHALVGLRLPTGSANPNHYWTAANGSRILSRDPVLQTGYGTTDPILGLQWMNGQRGGRTLYVGTLYRRTSGRNPYGYHFGDEFQVTAGASLPLGRNVTFLPQLYGQISGHDFDWRPLPGKHAGEVGNTGGRWLYFMPSVRWNSLSFDLQVPLYRKTNGNILNPSVIFTVRANTELRLTRAARVQRAPQQGSTTPAAGDFQVVSHGEAVELAPHAAGGKITLFEFASRHCAACQALAPALLALLRQRSDLALRQIDVTNPSAPAVAQYGIQATPAFVIVGRDGARVNPEPVGFDEVRAWLGRQAGAGSAAPERKEAITQQ